MSRQVRLTEDQYEEWKAKIFGQKKVRGVVDARHNTESGSRRDPAIHKTTSRRGESAPSPILPREIVIVGQMPSGKTSGVKEGYTKTGKKYRYPNARFKAWRELTVDSLIKQWKDHPAAVPVRLHCLYWPGDRRTRDVPGIEDAMLHALVKAGVLKDDGLVWDCLWYRQPMNRKGPKVLITVSEWI